MGPQTKENASPRFVPLPEDLSTILLNDRPPELAAAADRIAAVESPALKSSAMLAFAALAKAGTDWQENEFWMAFHLVGTKPAYRYFLAKVGFVLAGSGISPDARVDILCDFLDSIRLQPRSANAADGFLAPSPFRQYDPLRPPKSPRETERRLLPYLGACLGNFLAGQWRRKKRRQNFIVNASELQNAESEMSASDLDQFAAEATHPHWELIHGHREDGDPAEQLGGGGQPTPELLAEWVAEFIAELKVQDTEVSRRAARLLAHLLSSDTTPNLRELAEDWDIPYATLRQTKCRAEQALAKFGREKWAGLG